MASIVVVLFGIPLAATKRRRGGLAVQVGINILVTFIYLVFMKVSQAFERMVHRSIANLHGLQILIFC